MSRKARVQPTGADAAPEIGSDLNEHGELPLFFPALAVEGMATSDRRTIKPGALGHRALPISILAQYTNPGQQGGHAGAEVIGHLTKIWRTPGQEVTSRETGQPFPEGTFVWQGEGVADPDTTGGSLARKGHLRGNSVDLSEIDFTEEFGEDGADAGITITAGKIAATTLCPIPAFADAYVQIGDDDALAASGEPVPVPEDLESLDGDEFERVFNANPPGDNPEGAARLLAEALRRRGVVVASSAILVTPLPPFRAAELGDDCGPCLAEVDTEWTEDAQGQFAPTVAKRKRAFARGLAMKGDKADGSDASYPIENQADLDKAAGMVGLGSADNSAIKAHIRKAARKLGLKLPQSLQASAVPDLPPVTIFSDPQFAAPAPMTIGEPRADGRREISGHIATWSSCHASYGTRCVRPPHSRTDYARFATGAARALDATGSVRTMAVGRISMSRSASQGGHAPATLSEADTVAFYDNQCTAVADVAAGEDAYGIWVHGLTRQLSEAEVDQLLSSPPSGDWRNHQGNLELCAILAVNTPGYVVPRSRVASGEPQSLVAAGMLKPGSEFAPPGGLTLPAIRAVIQQELINFFDPDNDGDIDRPMDDDDDAAAPDEGDSQTAAGYQPKPYRKGPDETVKCPNCGKYDAPDARYCDQCGTKLAGNDAVVASMADRQAAALLSIRRNTALAPFGSAR